MADGYFIEFYDLSWDRLYQAFVPSHLCTSQDLLAVHRYSEEALPGLQVMPRSEVERHKTWSEEKKDA